MGVAVYLVANSIAPQYQSNAQFRVTVPNQAGLNDTVVTAANDLATQYAQLATASDVIESAARSLDMPAGELTSEISGSTVNGQNIVQVTATASTKDAAQARAGAVARALRRYLNRINAEQGSTYAANVSRGLEPLEREIEKYSRQLDRARGTERTNLNVLLGSLLTQRQQVLASLAQDTAAGQPTLQGTATASGASRSSPDPRIYGLVGFLVAALLSARVAYLVLRRPGQRP